MKILVFGDRLDVGGTQVNAIELAAALRDFHGHEVVYFATPGPMLKYAEEKQLRFLPAPDAHIHPSFPRMPALYNAVRRERPDLIHVWDWTQLLDAYYVAHIMMRIPMVVSVMSMAVPRLLPKALPTTLGTPELLEHAQASGRPRLELVLPPVDVHYNSPAAVDSQPFRKRYGLGDNEITIVTVSRLVGWMKAESLRRTIEVVRRLGREFSLRFVIVGDGTARADLEAVARTTNTELGREAVIFTGAMVDPRPAYAAADIVVGMGGSILRGMAFSKPVVVVGEQGFSKPLYPENAESIYYKGMYGLGDGDPDNERLLADVSGLLERRNAFHELGQFSRDFVLQRFSLEMVSARLEQFCSSAVAETPKMNVAIADGLRTAAITFGRKLAPETLRHTLGSSKM